MDDIEVARVRTAFEERLNTDPKMALGLVQFQLLEKLSGLIDDFHEQLNIEKDSLGTFFTITGDATPDWVDESKTLMNEILDQRFPTLRAKSDAIIFHVLIRTVVRAILAGKAATANDLEAAFLHSVHGIESAGMCRGLILGRSLEGSKSVHASLSAAKRHDEHRAMKQEVFAWLDIHRSEYKSMDATAEAIAGKVAPIAFRTARDWVGEWKKVRSARETLHKPRPAVPFETGGRRQSRP